MLHSLLCFLIFGILAITSNTFVWQWMFCCQQCSGAKHNTWEVITTKQVFETGLWFESRLLIKKTFLGGFIFVTVKRGTYETLINDSWAGRTWASLLLFHMGCDNWLCYRLLGSSNIHLSYFLHMNARDIVLLRFQTGKARSTHLPSHLGGSKHQRQPLWKTNLSTPTPKDLKWVNKTNEQW